MKEKKLQKTEYFWRLALYLTFLTLEIFLIHEFSDLPVSIGNWLYKADQVISFHIPSDNFYGPGAAILLAPFVWLRNDLFIVILIYFILGSVAYWKICELITHVASRRIAKAALPCNVYLLWLINSSQDTVFEFFLLLYAIYFLVRKKYPFFSICSYLLCLTRAGYWTFFVGTTLIILISDLKVFKKIFFKKILAIPFLLITSVFNFVHYGSPSPALEGGMTAYFSYSKYHYLSLPKMDMDVFLSGPNGIFSKEHGKPTEEFKSGQEANSELFNAALDSIFENKKETLLGWMQKIDSYYFDVQKIPHLPGRYQLDLSTNKISIENDRLSWPIVMGYLLYFLSRILLVISGFLAIGGTIFHKLVFGKFDLFLAKYWALSLPYIFGIIPGVLFYTETRFKIVSELILVPLIIGIWSTLYSEKRVNKLKLAS